MPRIAFDALINVPWFRDKGMNRRMAMLHGSLAPQHTQMRKAECFLGRCVLDLDQRQKNQASERFACLKEIDMNRLK
jgi:hypothetical protein